MLSLKGFVSATTMSVLLLSACGAATPSATSTPPGPQIVNVTLTTYGFKFSPPLTQLKAGDVKFLVKNEATDAVHEFFFVKTPLAADKLPLGDDGAVDEESKDFDKEGSVEDVDPGKAGEMEAKLEPGHYVFFCNKPGHFKLGMTGEVTIAQ